MKRLFVDSSVAGSPVAEAISKKIGILPSLVDGPGPVYRAVSESPDPEAAGKKVLFLTKNSGTFIKDCPGTSHYTCCGYRILHIGTYCVMDCSYCILQAYFHPPVLQFFVNHGEMKKALALAFEDRQIMRIGTGEYTDSLIWESFYPLSKTLVPLFASQSSCVLELKSKTTAIKNLLDLEHNRKTIMAWSVNTGRVIHDQERGTTSLENRILTAKTCVSSGYPVAFHFDPMLIYDGCEDEYIFVVDFIFDNIPADEIVWISMGAFRFMPLLKPILERRFPASRIVYNEFVRGIDSKMRYFKPLRMRLYRSVIDRIRKRAPDVCVYFCMEDEEVWEKTMGFSPAVHGGLARMLDVSAKKHCGLSGRFRPGPISY
ncbi:MAG: DNA photolyase [Deltaproteobacteria bacterium]|nr:DNA photolyase [Deltaproteobacteria bacterium]